MNKIKEFKSLQDVYFKRVLLKENVENKLPSDLEQKIEDNMDELKKAVEGLEAELLANKEYQELKKSSEKVENDGSILHSGTN